MVGALDHVALTTWPYGLSSMVDASGAEASSEQECRLIDLVSARHAHVSYTPCGLSDEIRCHESTHHAGRRDVDRCFLVGESGRAGARAGLVSKDGTAVRDGQEGKKVHAVQSSGPRVHDGSAEEECVLLLLYRDDQRRGPTSQHASF